MREHNQKRISKQLIKMNKPFQIVIVKTINCLNQKRNKRLYLHPKGLTSSSRIRKIKKQRAMKRQLWKKRKKSSQKKNSFNPML